MTRHEFEGFEDYSFRAVVPTDKVEEVDCQDKKYVKVVYNDGRVVKYFYNKIVSEE